MLKSNRCKVLGVVIVLIGIIVMILVGVNIYNDMKESKVVYGDSEIINEYNNVLDITDIEVRDSMLEIIESGISGYYEIKGNNYAILTTGGDSATDIEYRIDNDTSGNTKVLYKLGQEPDGKMELRYKILEFNGAVVVSEEVEFIALKNGITTGIVYTVGDSKYFYNTIDTVEVDSKLVDGIYAMYYEDGEIIKNEKIDSILLEDIKIVGRNDNRNYNVELSNGAKLTMIIDSINLYIDGIEMKYDILVSYDKGFKGSLV